ncbi:vacuolar protein sorting-associated protein 29 isoform X3 [Nannospalax galili]|uniref:vacuolar protein sorting-associated protein 29 isoform X3 n=1 Tax=Nannospalax galili TaxID=1026970 RepID=UPI00111BEF59|nr:vacuolar protein sorting-associated protein 29 isoform X3 [Nannospalax galili]
MGEGREDAAGPGVALGPALVRCASRHEIRTREPGEASGLRRDGVRPPSCCPAFTWQRSAGPGAGPCRDSRPGAEREAAGVHPAFGLQNRRIHVMCLGRQSLPLKSRSSWCVNSWRSEGKLGEYVRALEEGRALTDRELTEVLLLLSSEREY